MDSKKDATCKLLRWISENKGDSSVPIALSAIIPEYKKTHINEFTDVKDVAILKKRIKRALEKPRGEMTTFTTYEIIHLQFLLSVSLTDQCKAQLEDIGNLTLDAHARIMAFHSNDGLFSRGGFHRTNGNFKKSRQSASEYEESPNTTIQVYEGPSNVTNYADLDSLVFFPEEVKPKIHEEPPLKRIKRSTLIAGQDVPAHSILTPLHHLILVLNFPSLESMGDKISMEDVKPGRQMTIIPYEEFSDCTEHCLRVLLRGATTEVDVEAMQLVEFLRMFKFFLLSVGVSPDGSLVEQVTEEIDKCKVSMVLKMIPIEKVQFVIMSIFQTATPATNMLI